MRPKLQPHYPAACQWLPKVALLIVLTLSANGCSLLKSTLELPEKGIRSLFSLHYDNPAPDPVELQSLLLRFADDYIDALSIAFSKLQETDGQPSQRRNMLMRRIATTNDVLGTATGANAYANLLDMVILVTLNRMNVEDYWMPKRFGNSAKPLLLASQENVQQFTN